ncbi:MAG: methyltransferase domain-containing protein [Candidatus Binataceae bacterium]|nr:methyltransferase domain-containing protein [Candidatus Binataceae bacterium]
MLNRGPNLIKQAVEPEQHLAQNGSWSRQRHFYDEECDPEFEITRPHGCGRLYDFLIEHKFRTGLAVLGLDIAGMSVLEVCCGSGMMSEKFVRADARVTGTDFSPAAIARARDRARRYHFDATFLVADAENLAFSNHSFDIVAVHDGLHHLDNPERAIREMARVARRGVLILDPAQAALTNLAVKLGIAVDVEEAGNPVRRLDPQAVAATLRKAGFDRIIFRRTLMYYPHEPYRWFAWFDHPLLFFLFRTAFAGANLALGRWGNKLSLAAR